MVDRHLETKLVLLGTGTPNADPHRSGPATAIVLEDSAYLIDAGPGVVRQASAASEKGITVLQPTQINRCFISHLHSDHTLGLPDLIFSPWVLGREVPLELWGPPGLQSMVDHLMAAYAKDVRERIEGLEPANATGGDVIVHEIEPGRIHEIGDVCLEAFAVNHGAWPSYGYRFRSADRTIIVSGDTAPFPDWEKVYANCDILVHEVQSGIGLANRSSDWQTYHRAVHTTANQLAGVASLVRPRLLVLTHLLFHGVSEKDLLAEIQSIFNGEVVCGKDLDVF